MEKFMQTTVIVLIALIVAVCAVFMSKVPDSPVEQAAEAVMDYELGLPQGTIDISKELGEKKT